jgi:hypothetical protein
MVSSGITSRAAVFPICFFSGFFLPLFPKPGGNYALIRQRGIIFVYSRPVYEGYDIARL